MKRFALWLTAGFGVLQAGGVAAQTPISFVHRSPLVVREGQSVVIEGQMLGASEVESVELVYKSGATPSWRNLEFELMSADHYRVEIPASEVRPPLLEYYVVAIDFLENRHAALASEARPVEVKVEATPAASTSIAATPTPRPLPARPKPREVAAPADPAEAPKAAPALADRRAATSVSIIERDAIDAVGARTLLDILAMVPEVEARRDVAGFDRVAVRGRGEDSEVLLLVDGLVQNSVYDGRAFWRLPAGIIERVVVQRGGAADRDGMAGLAATVTVTTRRDTHRRASVAAGTYLSHTRDEAARRYGSYALTALGGVASEPLRLTAFAGVDVSDGTQATVRQDALSLAGESSATPGPARDGGLRLASGAALALDEVMPGAFTLSGHYFFERRGGEVGLISAYSAASRVSSHTVGLAAEHSLADSDKHALRYRLAVDVQRFSRSFELAPEGFVLGTTRLDRDFIEETSGALFGVVGEAESVLKPADDHRMRIGVVVAHHRGSEPEVQRTLDANGDGRPLAPVDYATPALTLARTSVSGRLLDTWSVRADMTVEFGLRFTYVSDVATQASKQFNPLLRITYQATDRLDLEIAYGSSYRPPTLAERADRIATTLPLGLRADRTVGASDLPGTAQHTVEAGLAYARTLDRLDAYGRAALFYQRVVDAITKLASPALYNPLTGLTAVGVRPQIDQIGALAEGKVQLGQEATVHLASWWTRSTDNGERGVTLLTDVAQMGALASLRLGLAEVIDAYLTARYRSERRNNARTLDERVQTFTLPADLAVHAALRTRVLWEHFRWGLVVHNLFDAALDDPAPRPNLLPGMVPGEGLQVLFTVEVSE